VLTNAKNRLPFVFLLTRRLKHFSIDLSFLLPSYSHCQFIFAIIFLSKITFWSGENVGIPANFSSQSDCFFGLVQPQIIWRLFLASPFLFSGPHHIVPSPLGSSSPLRKEQQNVLPEIVTGVDKNYSGSLVPGRVQCSGGSAFSIHRDSTDPNTCTFHRDSTHPNTCASDGDSTYPNNCPSDGDPADPNTTRLDHKR
jgi:hypothetical protein